MKYFRMSWDEIVYQRSVANIIMLLATIPDYSEEKKDNNIIKLENPNDLDKIINAHTK